MLSVNLQKSRRRLLHSLSLFLSLPSQCYLMVCCVRTTEASQTWSEAGMVKLRLKINCLFFISDLFLSPSISQPAQPASQPAHTHARTHSSSISPCKLQSVRQNFILSRKLEYMIIKKYAQSECVRCGVRTHALFRVPELKSGALDHSANLTVIELQLLFSFYIYFYSYSFLYVLFNI